MQINQDQTRNFLTHSSLNLKESYYCVLEVVQNGLEIIFKSCLYAELIIGSASYSWCCFVLLATFILRLILIDSFTEEFSTPSSLIKTCMRILGFILICSALLKIDGLTTLSWTSIFWYLFCDLEGFIGFCWLC